MTTNSRSDGGGLVPVSRSVPVVADSSEMRDWADQLVARARSEGIELTGDNGLLTAMVRQVLQTGLNVELAEHVGYQPYAVEGRGSGNNGSPRFRVGSWVVAPSWACRRRAGSGLGDAGSSLVRTRPA